MLSLLNRSIVILAASLAMLSDAFASASDVLRVNCRKGANLQAAIAGANDGDIIEIVGTCPGNFVITDKSLTLKARSGNATLDAEGSGAVLSVRSDGPTPKDVVLEGLVITGGDVVTPIGGTAGIDARGVNLTLDGCTVTDNHITSTHPAFSFITGGIRFSGASGTLTLDGSTVSHNSATMAPPGGVFNADIITEMVAAIGLASGNLNMSDSSVEHNQATMVGTRVFLDGIGFSAPQSAAGLQLLNATSIRIDHSLIAHNTNVMDLSSDIPVTFGLPLARGAIHISSPDATPAEMTNSVMLRNNTTAIVDGDFVIAASAQSAASLDSSLRVVDSLFLLNTLHAEFGTSDGSHSTIFLFPASGDSLLSIEGSLVARNRVDSTRPAGSTGLAVAGVSNGDSLDNAAAVELIDSRVVHNVAQAAAGNMSVGGISDQTVMPGQLPGENITLDGSAVKFNHPIDCNFEDPACGVSE